MKHFSLIFLGLLLASAPVFAGNKKYENYMQQLQSKVVLGKEKFQSSSFKNFSEEQQTLDFSRYYKSPKCGITLYAYDNRRAVQEKEGMIAIIDLADGKEGTIPATPEILGLEVASAYDAIAQRANRNGLFLMPKSNYENAVVDILMNHNKKEYISKPQILSGITSGSAEAVGVLDYKGNILKTRVTCHSPKEKALSETIAKQGLLWMKSEFDKKK